MRKGQKLISKKHKGHSSGSKHQSDHGERQNLQGAKPSAEKQAAPPPATQGAGERSSTTCQAAVSTQLTWADVLTKKTSVLLHFLLEKCEKRELILHIDLQKVVHRKYKPHFFNIVRRAATQLELVYGLQLNQGDPSSLSYYLVSKVGPYTGKNLSSIKEFPKRGLLLSLLGLIFMKGNHATEEDIWEFLNVLGIHAGKRHFIFGEPQNFINKALLQESYLEYRQVPGSVPPCYEYLWGPRAHAETTKMKALDVLAKISGTKPSAFPSLHEEALREKAERARRKAETKASSVDKNKGHRKCKTTNYFHI